jgi:protein-tyrosine phosphatase
MTTARRDSLARLDRAGIRRVLVVCYGNIYRSAFVGADLAQRSIPQIEIRSAGLHPVAGRSSPSRHVEMSLRYGVELADHRSAVLASEDLAWADLIVLMDRHNWQSLVERGAARERMVWLGALDGGGIEITDPYKLDAAGAERIVERLAICSEQLAARLRG